LKLPTTAKPPSAPEPIGPTIIEHEVFGFGFSMLFSLKSIVARHKLPRLQFPQFECILDKELRSKNLDQPYFKQLMASTNKRKAQHVPRGSETMFPGKLHDMLDYVELQAFEFAISSWVRDDGTTIMIHDS
jgi:hypothetical protein